MNCQANPQANIYFANFNQDARYNMTICATAVALRRLLTPLAFSCVAIGQKDGFFVYNVQPKFSLMHHQGSCARLSCVSHRVAAMGGVGIAELLFNSSLTALVGTFFSSRPSLHAYPLYRHTRRRSQVLSASTPPYQHKDTGIHLRVDLHDPCASCEDE